MRWVGRRLRGGEIAPDEIFLDASNLPGLDAQQLEGRVERPVSGTAVGLVGALFILVAVVYAGRAFSLQVIDGDTYADISRNNRIERTVLFAARGIIYDRTGTELAWNTVEINPERASTTPYALRHYIAKPGFAHLLGFVRYPKADQLGSWWREEYVGVSGIEHTLDWMLAGQNGSSLSETDARGELVREDIVDPPHEGESVHLSVDADMQAALAHALSNHAEQHRFEGGAGVIMDVHTGELLALTSFPEYDNAAFARGEGEAVRNANENARRPLLNRAVSGVYSPGSIVKPILAAAALAENIIAPEKKILSTGSIEIPNPYFPDKPSIFKDWKAHGYVDMRRAIAVSSDVYFYAVGGGFQDQVGLGIARIDDYAKKFGLSIPTGIILGGEAAGVIPTPEWKKEVFNGEPWRLGDTYNTSIGQYGFQITPLQAVRYAAAIGNGGQLLTPKLLRDATPEAIATGVSDEHLAIVREGMRAGVNDGGTAQALNMGGIEIAAKTGTAQLGIKNQYVNSWVIGFWPASDPKYAFAAVLEKAPSTNASGATAAMTNFFYWLRDAKPEYVR